MRCQLASFAEGGGRTNPLSCDHQASFRGVRRLRRSLDHGLWGAGRAQVRRSLRSRNLPASVHRRRRHRVLSRLRLLAQRLRQLGMQLQLRPPHLSRRLQRVRAALRRRQGWRALRVMPVTDAASAASHRARQRSKLRCTRGVLALALLLALAASGSPDPRRCCSRERRSQLGGSRADGPFRSPSRFRETCVFYYARGVAFFA